LCRGSVVEAAHRSGLASARAEEATQEPEPYVPEVHPSVRAGIKDDGEAEGTGGYDDELLMSKDAAASMFGD